MSTTSLFSFNILRTFALLHLHFLVVPDDLVMKTPVDGLQDFTDEERFGYTYEELDNYIRYGKGDIALIDAIIGRYKSGKFKIDMVNIDGPDFNFPDYIQEKNV